MTNRRTEDLVHELAQDAKPVRTIARLRIAAASVALLWMAAVGVSAVLGGGLPHLVSGSGLHGLVLGGLAVGALGGVLAALAGAVPGRESVERIGSIALWLGLSVALGAGIAGTVGARPGPAGPLLAGSSACFARGLAVGLPPLWIASAFLARGALRHVRWGAAIASFGTIGLGALAVHATCTMTGGFHVLLGHCLAPLIGTAVLIVPLSAWIARTTQKRSSVL